MKRKPLSRSARVALFLAHDGRCHLCGGRITPGERWEVEHRIPLAQGGEDGGENLLPAHVKCHRAKTAQDAADTAKAKRREAAHIGATRSKRPMPGSRASGWKRKMDGTVVPRERP